MKHLDDQMATQTHRRFAMDKLSRKFHTDEAIAAGLPFLKSMNPRCKAAEDLSRDREFVREIAARFANHNAVLAGRNRECP